MKAQRIACLAFLTATPMVCRASGAVNISVAESGLLLGAILGVIVSWIGLTWLFYSRLKQRPPIIRIGVPLAFFLLPVVVLAPLILPARMF